VFIVFNGEIYNFQDVREDLIKRGYKFKTKSDTEVILHAYEEFGEKCVDYLRGMFAFAIWNKTDESLFIARDRVGKKPLFYSLTDKGDFVFGSELKSLLLDESISREIDISALDSYLTFGYVPEDFCIFKNIHKLPPASTLTYKNGKIEIKKYWDFEYVEPVEVKSEAEYIEELQRLITEAVRIRMISEVPLGAFLSGGVDSSSIVGVMSKLSDKPVKTFSIGFNEDTFNELKYARIAAKHFNTEHHEFIVTPELVNLVDDLVWHFDEPFADPSSLPTFMVSKMARDFVTVVLSGDGGDEIFAGYTRYVTDKKRSGFNNLPKFLRKGVQGVAEKLPHSTKGKYYLYNSSLDAIERYIDSVSHFNQIKRKSLYAIDFQSQLNGKFGVGEELFKQLAEKVSTENPTDNLLYLDSKTYLPSDILVKVDRMSMATSLEARVPLLDHKLIEFVKKIPTELKLKGLETKYIFKKAMEVIVPNEILYREKQGFGVPINEWINSQLKEKIHTILSENKTLSRGYFDVKYIKTLLDEHQTGRRDHSYSLWILYVLELWHRKFVDK
jgi:asparagine synthase (glutamine-hydrolysing)